jgi:hypothetical protein
VGAAAEAKARSEAATFGDIGKTDNIEQAYRKKLLGWAAASRTS